MTQAVRVAEDYVWVVERHVDEGQSIEPGMPVIDVMTPDGFVSTITAEGWGIVGHIEGKRTHSNFIHDGFDALQGDNDDLRAYGDSDLIRNNKGMDNVFAKGDVICHIVPKPQHGAGQKTGLRPAPSNWLRMLRMGLASQ